MAILTADELRAAHEGINRMTAALEGTDGEVRVAILIGTLVAAAAATQVPLDELLDRIEKRYLVATQSGAQRDS